MHGKAAPHNGGQARHDFNPHHTKSISNIVVVLAGTACESMLAKQAFPQTSCSSQHGLIRSDLPTLSPDRAEPAMLCTRFAFPGTEYCWDCYVQIDVNEA